MYSTNNTYSSYLMAFRENLNSDGIYPIMIMPNVSSCNNNTLFQNNNTSQNPTSFFMDNYNYNINNDDFGGSSSSSTPILKAKIMAHPSYHRLLAAYVKCQKVGALPEVVARLEEAYKLMLRRVGPGYVGEDPGLDEFMEVYCEMLNKYEQELTKPFKKAMFLLSITEAKFEALTLSSSDHSGLDRNNSFEEEAEFDKVVIDSQADDKELKGRLLRKYSGYIGSLKQEFMKKKKKGKLPKEAREQLFDWWSRNHTWPYPSVSTKMELAELTGLEPKQINNWFINQRIRHWKPSEDM